MHMAVIQKLCLAATYLRVSVRDLGGPIGALSGAGDDCHHLTPVFRRDLHLVRLNVLVACYQI
jgi:hypothetical protein